MPSCEPPALSWRLKEAARTADPRLFAWNTKSDRGAGSRLAVAREADGAGGIAKRGHRIVLRTRHEEDRAVLLSRQRPDEHLQPDGEREGLVRLLAAEREELCLVGGARQDVAVRDLSHGDVGDEWPPVRARDSEGEGVRSRKRRPAIRTAETPRRGRRQRGDETSLSQAAHPVAEKAGREAARREDDPPSFGRLGELCLDDPCKRHVPERAFAVPALVAGLGGQAARVGSWVELDLTEPRDPGDPVTRPATAIGVLEVVCQNPRLGLAEAELPELLERAQAETSGSGLTMPTPCSRFVASIASASATIARETSASGSASTIGSPSSA
jgi:hypothetical protein